MKKMFQRICSIALLMFFMIACSVPAPTSIKVANDVETLAFFRSSVLMEVISFSADSIQLRLTNNSNHLFTFPPCHQRRTSPDSSGIFAIDYFNEEHWMEVVPAPYIWDYDIAALDTSYQVQPGQYVVAEYCLELHPILTTEIGRYRVRMDIFLHGSPLSHTLVAEFYWHGE